MKDKKNTILTQECLRRMRNTKQELGQEVRKKHLNGFMFEVKNSGHSQNFRKQILVGVFRTFDLMLEDDKSGNKLGLSCAKLRFSCASQLSFDGRQLNSVS